MFCERAFCLYFERGLSPLSGSNNTPNSYPLPPLPRFRAGHVPDRIWRVPEGDLLLDGGSESAAAGGRRDTLAAAGGSRDTAAVAGESRDFAQPEAEVSNPSHPTSPRKASAASRKALKIAAAAAASNSAPLGSPDLIQGLHRNARRLFAVASYRLVHTFGLSTLSDDEVGRGGVAGRY